MNDPQSPVVAVTTFDETIEAQREENFNHFLRLARRGRHKAASGGERRAAQLAQAICDHVTGVDDMAISGMIDFVQFVRAQPGTARDLLEGR